MNKIRIAVTGLLAAAVFSSFAVQAQEQARAQPVEMYVCSWQEGKGPGDLKKVTDKFSNWADKNGPGYNAWTITPNFRSIPDGDGFDIGWIGSWADHKEMGSTLDNWATGGGDLQEAFNDVIDCSNSHVLMASVAVNAPDGPPDDGLVMFSSCKVDEDSNHEAAFAAHKKAAGAMREKGMNASGSWLFYPSLGPGGESKFDYYLVATWPNYAALSQTFEAFHNKGGWKARQQAFKGVVSCDTPRLYDARVVRKGKR